MKKAMWICGMVLVLEASRLMAEPTVADAAAFRRYTGAVEMRLVRQHRAAEGRDADAFLALAAPDRAAAEARMRRGEVIVNPVLEPQIVATFNSSMLHHWRGTAFAPGARAADFERIMQDFRAYPQRFAPEVVSAGSGPAGDHMQAWMRVRQHHVITVVMDTAYDVTFGRTDARHGYSVSVSTRIAEIEAAGTRSERTLSATEEHGFLWRQNTYWSYEERDGGLYLQVESVSLTRAVPRGLGWVVGPFVESIPRESMAFTLASARAAIEKQQVAKQGETR